MYYCKHSKTAWVFNPFGKDREPSPEEIKEFRLYQCPDCLKWFSLRR